MVHKDYGKVYEKRKALALLNEIVDTAKDLAPTEISPHFERFEISGSLYNEIYNFLLNNNLRK